MKTTSQKKIYAHLIGSLSFLVAGCNANGMGSGNILAKWNSADSGFTPLPVQDTVLPVADGTSTAAKVWDTQLTQPHAGIVFVTGVDGGFIEPVDGIYQRLADTLEQEGVDSVFVQYRQPGVVDPSVQDALAGVNYLRTHHVDRMAIVGWSFGGATITNTAPQVPEIVTLIGFSPQSKDTEAAALLKPYQSVLLFHSHDDDNVPFGASQEILDETPAENHKMFVPLEGYDHFLTGAQNQVDPVALSWLKKELLGE